MSLFAIVSYVQEQVLAESEVMIPDCRGRLENALQELQTVVVRAVVPLSRVGRSARSPKHAQWL